MREKKLNRIGEIRMMNCGMKAEIIAYRRADDIDVMFEDGYVAKNKKYCHFESSKINNPCLVTIFSVGSIGNTTTTINGKHKKSYMIWSKMLDRCYNKKHKGYKNYGGRGVTICDEWLCYENFEKWFDKNYYELKEEKVQLDKDILIKDNKVYSPDTCIFVPQRINSFFTERRDRDLPKGVKKHRSKYIAQITTKNEYIYIGTYDTIDEAKENYLQYRSIALKSILEEYENKIPEYVLNKLKKVI